MKNKKKIEKRQLILLLVCVLCAVLIALGMFLPWSTLVSGSGSQGIPLFDSSYTIMSNYEGTLPISIVRFVSLLCALGCAVCTFIIIFDVTELSPIGENSKLFCGIVTILVGLAVAGISIYYLIVLNDYFQGNNSLFFTVGFGIISIPFGAVASGVSLLLYK